MPNYRRARIEGGTYFFTVVTYERRKLFHLEKNRRLLGEAVRACRNDWPFEVNAIVLLSDHLHANWTLPAGDGNRSGRWSVIKKNFTAGYLCNGGDDRSVSVGKRREGRRGVWQPRFWEHAIENEADFDAHFDYVHYNPVKHKLAQRPADWMPSSFHQWVRKGVYAEDWGRLDAPAPQIPDRRDDYGEPE